MTASIQVYVGWVVVVHSDCLNLKFTQKTKIRQVAKKLAEDRQYEMDAKIVRIMKARRVFFLFTFRFFFCTRYGEMLC